MPPSQVVSFLPLNGVMPPSGKVCVSAPLSVVKTTMVLSSSPMSSSFLSTKPMLSSICFMPASLMPQSLPPFSPSIARYFVRQHGRDVHARRVVPDEERLVGLLRVVAIEEVDDLGRDLLVDRLRPLERQRALVLARLVLRRAVGRLAPEHRARRRQADRRPSGPPRPGTSGSRGSACSCTAARSPARSGSC